MKNFTLLIGFFILLVSCSPSKEEQLISDYEQTIGNTKTNLNLKFEKVEFVKDITSKDSLLFLTKDFNKKRENIINKIESLIESYEKMISGNKKLKRELKGVKIKKTTQEWIDKDIKNIEKNRVKIELYNGDCKGTFLELTYNKIKKLETNLDSILCKEYSVVYTINNPMLNNVEQTISKKYFINSEKSKILKVSKETE